MSSIQMAFIGLVFLAVFGVAAFIVGRLSSGAIQERLRSLGRPLPPPELGKPTPGLGRRLIGIISPLGKLSLPDEGWEKSGIRVRFLNAGIRGSSAPASYFSAKTLLALGLPLLAYLVLQVFPSNLSVNKILLLLLCVATVGYYLPNLILAHLISIRQREIFESFPDALDLMTVCVEAGLGVDAALARVADDIETKSEVLSEELKLVGLELRAGSDRVRALRNLATRTGVEEIDAWVAMLVQADKFGTSIAASLRIHSEMLRTKRRQRAEEAASKIALKLLFPLIFCIFPTLLLVLLGPGFIQIYRVLLPAMTGGAQ